MPLQSSLIHLGLAKETTQGTPLAATAWMPISNNIKDEDVVKWVEDKGLRGAPVVDIQQYQGPISSSMQFDSLFYPDVPPNLLMALMGTDTVTGATAPYSHAFTLALGQPPSYTLSLYNGYNERQYSGSMLEQLDLKWALEGALSANAKWTGWPSVIGTTSTPTIGTTPPFLGWGTALTIGGSVNARMIGFDWSGKRKVDAQFAADNTQKPAFTYAGPLAVTSKMTFAIADETELNYMLNNTQPSVSLVLTAPSSGPTLTIQMSKAAFSKKGVSYGKEFVTCDYDITALANTTDAGSGSPISPVKFILTNSQQTAY